MKPEQDMDQRKQISEKIIAEAVRIKSDDLVWQTKKDSLFAANLDYLDMLSEQDRVSILDGVDPVNPEKTRTSKKKWADKKAAVDIDAEIRRSLSDDDIVVAIRKQQEKEREKRFARFEPLAREIGVSLDPETKQNLILAEEKINGLSAIPPVNPRRLRRFLIEAATGVESLKLFYIKCARFAFPDGKVAIIPSLDDFSYRDKNGRERFRPGSNETNWVANTKRLSQDLQNLGIENDVQVVVADTDIRDVRALPEDGDEANNLRTYMVSLQEKYPELSVTSFSQVETDLDLETQYRDFYSKGLTNLLTNGTNDPNVLKIQKSTLESYGYSPEAVDTFFDRCEENQKENFSVPISTQTVDTVTEEERLSQGNVLESDRCSYAFMRIYSCGRIARDLAQFGTILPAVGKNVAYVSDRKLKAVDLGFTANKMLSQEKQVVIFQEYDKD